MNTSVSEEISLPAIIKVVFDGDSMRVGLSDGREISVPLAWYPRLSSATQDQLKHFEISPAGYGIHWPDLDEDLSVYGFLLPNPSNILEHASALVKHTNRSHRKTVHGKKAR